MSYVCMNNAAPLHAPVYNLHSQSVDDYDNLCNPLLYKLYRSVKAEQKLDLSLTILIHSWSSVLN